jgi:hypothetical protein
VSLSRQHSGHRGVIPTAGIAGLAEAGAALHARVERGQGEAER